MRASGTMRWPWDRFRTVSGVFAAIGALATAVIVHRWLGSWWLDLFVFTEVNYVVGRAVPDLVTEPERWRRGVFFALGPILSTAVLLVAWGLSERMWVAVVVGLVVGPVLRTAAGLVGLRDILADETARDLGLVDVAEPADRAPRTIRSRTRPRTG